MTPALKLVPPAHDPRWIVAMRDGLPVAVRVRHVEAAVERVEQSDDLKRALLAMAIERPA